MQPDLFGKAQEKPQRPAAARTTYRCARCLARFRHPIWEALELPLAEEKCPRCGAWSRFDAVYEHDEVIERAA